MTGRFFAGLGALALCACGPSYKAMSAGQVGCVESDIDISDESSGHGSETWVATCNGARFVCSKVKTGSVSSYPLVGNNAGVHGEMHQVDCAPEGGGGESRQASAPAPTAPAEPPKSSGPPPEGAAGFLLGKSVEESSETCTGSGHEWSALERGQFECGGLPEDIGLQGRAVLSFCGGKLCGIELVTQPGASGKSFAGSFTSLADALDKKYGTPEKRETEIPPQCRDKTALADCLANGSARLVRSWAWVSGERITMTVGGASGEGQVAELALRIIYTRRPSGFRPNTEAL